MNEHAWPELKLGEWRDTLATLHMWTQIVGKIRLELTPLVNHWWNVPLYVSARGLTTTAIPYGERVFEIEFDFIEHELAIRCSDGQTQRVELRPRSVASFYRDVMSNLAALGIEVKIWTMPVEVPSPFSAVQEGIPFERDEKHASYDAEYTNRFWRALVSIDDVFKKFRAHFVGKVSPVHFFWGSFDHAVTRFSGRPAAPRDGADKITLEAYSHEVISHGWWPGGGDFEASFYSYASPDPGGLASSSVRPADAQYFDDLGEFLLPYDAVRRSAQPEETLMEFLQSTYDAGADAAQWDRDLLERK